MQRNASPEDRRVRLLSLTEAGQDAARGHRAGHAEGAGTHPRAAARGASASEFMRMLRALVTANNELSRAPSEM